MWEAFLRARSTESAALLAYLERPGTRYDGHKGWQLSFRRWDHQLRQPLYRVASRDGTEQVVGEIPARPGNNDRRSHELLDRIGTPESASACRYKASA